MDNNTRSLSNRESEILQLIIEEYTTDEIATALSVTSETIKTHRKNMLVKLGARNVAGLVRRAFQYNIISIPSLKFEAVEADFDTF